MKLWLTKASKIQDLLAPLGVRLNIPPFLAGNTQMPESDVIHTKKIAQLRVHVERAIGRVKEFHILKKRVHCPLLCRTPLMK